jgi:hypothetical protein
LTFARRFSFSACVMTGTITPSQPAQVACLRRHLIVLVNNRTILCRPSRAQFRRLLQDLHLSSLGLHEQTQLLLTQRSLRRAA